MNESVFQQEIKESIEHLFPLAFYHKIADVGHKNSREKPFDCLFVYPTVTQIGSVMPHAFALELKQMREAESIKYNMVKKHQIDGLIKAQESGFTSFVVINWRYTAIFNLASTEINEAYFIPVEIWIDYGEFTLVSENMLCANSKVVKILREKVNGQTVWNLKKVTEAVNNS